MKKSDIYEVTIKILGLYLIIYCISYLREILDYFIFTLASLGAGFPNESQAILSLILSVFCFFVMLFFVWLLLFKTKWLTKKICIPTDLEENAKLFLEKKEVYQIAIVLCGLLLILWTLPDFVLKLSRHIKLVQSSSNYGAGETDFLITSALKIGLGLIAVSFSNSLSVFFSREKNPNS